MTIYQTAVSDESYCSLIYSKRWDKTRITLQFLKSKNCLDMK
jgi:hypothetical protein